MNKEELYLIYINYVGSSYDGTRIYEFIFSDIIDGVDGDDWDAIPAGGNPSPPHDFMLPV